MKKIFILGLVMSSLIFAESSREDESKILEDSIKLREKIELNEMREIAKKNGVSVEKIKDKYYEAIHKQYLENDKLRKQLEIEND